MCASWRTSRRSARAWSRRLMIHTVGPRYNAKYETAADNALHGCYRNCLRILKEAGLRTIAIPCIYADDKGYPRREAAHIAIRTRARVMCSAVPCRAAPSRPVLLVLLVLRAAGTVRRFCEHFLDDVDRIAFVVSSPGDEFIYLELLPLYFPRTVEEEIMAERLLPENTGNEWGEIVIEERKIRIAAVPGDASSLVTPVGACASLQRCVRGSCAVDPCAVDSAPLTRVLLQRLAS